MRLVVPHIGGSKNNQTRRRNGSRYSEVNGQREGASLNMWMLCRRRRRDENVEPHVVTQRAFPCVNKSKKKRWLCQTDGRKKRKAKRVQSRGSESSCGNLFDSVLPTLASDECPFDCQPVKKDDTFPFEFAMLLRSYFQR
ncbi:hypothetical protein HZH66_009563 [Vespula vulgaris]|uniref:Uncharacterized protein n=1 Tax=Vespula vulgaris TaxID=7454 RepID=A0A834N1T8_VESVU|nr:hypothetical protein HZH66_009563 [Vespula vulgaris]